MLTKQAQDRIALKSALNGNKIPKQVGRVIYVKQWFLIFQNSAALHLFFDKEEQRCLQNIFAMFNLYLLLWNL